MTAFPDRDRAEALWEEGIRYRLSRPYPFDLESEYRFHTRGVAEAAEKLPLAFPVLFLKKHLSSACCMITAKESIKAVKTNFTGRKVMSK